MKPIIQQIDGFPYKKLEKFTNKKSDSRKKAFEKNKKLIL